MRVSFVVFTLLIASRAAIGPAAQTPAADPLERFVGTWRIDRAESNVPALPADAQRQPGQRQGSTGRSGGRGGPAMGPMGFPGMGGGGGQPDEADLHRMDVLRRRLSEAPETLTIGRAGIVIEMADSDGRAFTLKADGKKQDRLSGDGEFKSRTRLNGSALVVEDDFGDGAKATTTYTTMLYGDERLLEIEVKVEGLPTGPPRMPGGQGGGARSAPVTSSKRVYEFDAPK
jgi:hypothetical protein